MKRADLADVNVISAVLNVINIKRLLPLSLSLFLSLSVSLSPSPYLWYGNCTKMCTKQYLCQSVEWLNIEFKYSIISCKVLNYIISLICIKLRMLPNIAEFITFSETTKLFYNIIITIHS